MARAPRPPALQALRWLHPWIGTAEALAPELERELAREIGPDHPLAGHSVEAVARRTDADDVLFWLPAGPALLALVHLTWQRRRERDPRWPATQLFSSVDEWIRAVMHPDHAAAGGPTDGLPRSAT
jgi:hypothetical protein